MLIQIITRGIIPTRKMLDTIENIMKNITLTLSLPFSGVCVF